jgi:hypothetical protein
MRWWLNLPYIDVESRTSVEDSVAEVSGALGLGLGLA